MKVRLFDISYDTDGHDVKDLPKVIETTLDEMGWDEDEDPKEFVNETGADFISDTTGWLVNWYRFEITDENN